MSAIEVAGTWVGSETLIDEITITPMGIRTCCTSLVLLSCCQRLIDLRIVHEDTSEGSAYASTGNVQGHLRGRIGVLGCPRGINTSNNCSTAIVTAIRIYESSGVGNSACAGQPFKFKFCTVAYSTGNRFFNCLESTSEGAVNLVPNL